MTILIHLQDWRKLGAGGLVVDGLMEDRQRIVVIPTAWERRRHPHERKIERSHMYVGYAFGKGE